MVLAAMQEVLVFFFFQAEDGIRDKLVTGVQTCALPILVIAGPYFCLELIEAAAALALSTDESPVAVTALDQALVVHTGVGGEPVTLAPYASLLIPAAAGTYRLEPAGPPASVTTRALLAYVPLSSP